MNEPDLVLFDEPTSSLDSKLGDQVVQLIREEMTARGTAAVIVTHDERITHHADRVVRIVDGKIADADADHPDAPEVSQQRADSRDGTNRSRIGTERINTRRPTRIQQETEETIKREADRAKKHDR